MPGVPKRMIFWVASESRREIGGAPEAQGDAVILGILNELQRGESIRSDRIVLEQLGGAPLSGVLFQFRRIVEVSELIHLRIPELQVSPRPFKKHGRRQKQIGFLAVGEKSLPKAGERRSALNLSGETPVLSVLGKADSGKDGATNGQRHSGPAGRLRLDDNRRKRRERLRLANELNFQLVATQGYRDPEGEALALDFIELFELLPETGDKDANSRIQPRVEIRLSSESLSRDGVFAHRLTTVAPKV